MAPNNDGISNRGISASGSRVNTDSFETTSNPPGSHVSFSIFGDSACGEPPSPQHLMLDFTPVEEVDNDFVQRKCCAFWDFLNSRTDLNSLMVMPEKNLYNFATRGEHSSRQDSIGTTPEKASLSIKEKTAVSMLEFVEEKGLIDRTFEAKLPQSMCSLGSREYRENETSARFKPIAHKREVCKCSGDCKSCQNRQPFGTVTDSSPEVKVLCTKMMEWDRKHPKSMEPPGHPPALSRCVMQRKLVS